MSDTNINQDTISDALDKNGSSPSVNMIMKLGKQIEENIRKDYFEDYFEDYRKDDTIDKIRDSLRNTFNKLKNSAVFINQAVQTDTSNTQSNEINRLKEKLRVDQLEQRMELKRFQDKIDRQNDTMLKFQIKFNEDMNKDRQLQNQLKSEERQNMKDKFDTDLKMLELKLSQSQRQGQGQGQGQINSTILKEIGDIKIQLTNDKNALNTQLSTNQNKITDEIAALNRKIDDNRNYHQNLLIRFDNNEEIRHKQVVSLIELQAKQLEELNKTYNDQRKKLSSLEQSNKDISSDLKKLIHNVQSGFNKSEDERNKLKTTIIEQTREVEKKLNNMENRLNIELKGIESRLNNKLNDINSNLKNVKREILSKIGKLKESLEELINNSNLEILQEIDNSNQDISQQVDELGNFVLELANEHHELVSNLKKEHGHALRELGTNIENKIQSEITNLKTDQTQKYNEILRQISLLPALQDNSIKKIYEQQLATINSLHEAQVEHLKEDKDQFIKFVQQQLNVNNHDKALLKQQGKHFNQLINNLENKHNEDNKRIFRLESLHMDQERRQDRSKEVEQYKNQFEKLQNTVNETKKLFNEHTSHFKNNLDTHSATISALNLKLSEFINKFSNDRNNIDNETKNNIKQILEEIEAIKSERRRMAQNVLDFANLLTQLTNALADLKKTREQFSIILNDGTQITSELNNIKLSEEKKKIKELEAYIFKLHQIINKQKSEPGFEKIIDKLQQELKEIQTKYDKLQENNQNLNEQLRICKEKKKSRDDKIEEYKKQQENMKKQITLLTRLLNESRERIEDLIRIYCEKKKELEKLKADNGKIAGLETEVARLKLLETELQKLKQDKTNDDKIKDGKIAKLEDEVEKLQENLRLEQVKVAEKKTEIEELEKVHAQEMADKIKELQQQINELQQQIQNPPELDTSELDKLKDELKILKNLAKGELQRGERKLMEKMPQDRLVTKIALLRKQISDSETRHSEEIEDLRKKKEKAIQEKHSAKEKLRNKEQECRETILRLEGELEKKKLEIQKYLDIIKNSSNEALKEKIVELKGIVFSDQLRIWRIGDLRKGEEIDKKGLATEIANWRSDITNSLNSLNKILNVTGGQRGGSLTTDQMDKYCDDPNKFKLVIDVKNLMENVENVEKYFKNIIEFVDLLKQVENYMKNNENYVQNNENDEETSLKKKIQQNNNEIENLERDNLGIFVSQQVPIQPIIPKKNYSVGDNYNEHALLDELDKLGDELDEEETISEKKFQKNVDEEYQEIVEENNKKLNEEINYLQSIIKKYREMLDVSDILKTKKNFLINSSQRGGRKSLAAEELYNKIIFRKDGGIKKLNLKKDRYKKKVHKIVNNLIETLYKSKGGNRTLKEMQLQKSLSAVYKERIPNIQKYDTFLNDKKIIYEKNESNFDESDIKSYNLSMGEISHYERIMTNIIDSWKKCGLNDMNDKIYDDIVILLADLESLQMGKKQEKLEDERASDGSALQFFEIPNYSILAKNQIKNNKVGLIEEMKFKYMNSKDQDELIEFLKDLYDEKYIMIIRYQKLFRKLKEDEEIKPTDSFKINRAKKNDSEITENKLQGELLQFLSKIKKKLDHYLILTRRPVSIFARINDVGRFQRKSGKGNDIIQDFDVSKKKCYKMAADSKLDIPLQEKWGTIPVDFNMENIQAVNSQDENLINTKFCDLIDTTDFVQWSEDKSERGFLTISGFSNSDENKKCPIILNEVNMLEDAKNVKFSEIFFRPEFNDNATISQYMLLDKLITKDIGTYLFTYGYSGVGKSYTLFGSQGVDGLLQSTITNIETNDSSNKLESIKLRIYELYGLGVGYSECWSDYNKIDQSVFDYKIEVYPRGDLYIKSLDEKRGENIPKYINEPKHLEKKRKKGDKKILNNFSKLVSQIDILRTKGNAPSSEKKYPERIKKTINNPVSSRGKLVYDFLFKFEDGQETPFIIDDSPGAENLLESYIYNNKEINENILKKIKENKNTPMKIQDEKVSWEFAMICAVLVQPLMLGFLNANGVILGYNKMSLNLFKRRRKRIDDYIDHIGLKQLKSREISHSDYCQKMYKQYETKVIMNYINNFVNRRDQESYKIAVLNEEISFYADGAETEKENMILASKLIYDTIKYCIDIKGNDLEEGESKYDLLIDLLTNIFELSNIFLKSYEKEDISKKINGDAKKFNVLWENQEKVIKNASYDLFYKKWVKYFNKNVDETVVRGAQHVGKKVSQDWKIADWDTTTMKSVQNFKNSIHKNDGDAWSVIFLGIDKDSNYNKESAVKNVFHKITSVHIKELHKLYDQDTDKRKPEFINYLIKNKLVGAELINDWVSELEKTISNQDATKATPEQINKTRKTIGDLITLSMESWYINQNIAGILRKCSQASGIEENVIEDNIVEYNKKNSMEKSSQDIENEYITNSHSDELTRTNSVIKYCQDHYKPNELFKVENFPKAITKLNEEAERTLVNDKKGFNTIKMDTIVSVLMEPYLSKKKNNKSTIEDFKMFYVLQNNKTKLKCYDQLRTFSMFTNFISRVIPTE